jgi:hypothetical protein
VPLDGGVYQVVGVKVNPDGGLVQSPVPAESIQQPFNHAYPAEYPFANEKAGSRKKERMIPALNHPD